MAVARDNGMGFSFASRESEPLGPMPEGAWDVVAAFNALLQMLRPTTVMVHT